MHPVLRSNELQQRGGLTRFEPKAVSDVVIGFRTATSDNRVHPNEAGDPRFSAPGCGYYQALTGLIHFRTVTQVYRTFLPNFMRENHAISRGFPGPKGFGRRRWAFLWARPASTGRLPAFPVGMPRSACDRRPFRSSIPHSGWRANPPVRLLILFCRHGYGYPRQRPSGSRRI